MAALTLGTQVGRYAVKRHLGAGGYGDVYEAVEHGALVEHRVALKLLKGSDPDWVARFEREVKTLEGVSHPHVVGVITSGVHVGAPWLAMRYIEGGSLKDLLDRGRLSRERMLRILRQVAEALDHMHQAGIVHRDLKPGNVLVADGDNAYIADFGLARMCQDAAITEPGTIVGTPTYMSPEQVAGQAIDGRSDTYALGVMAYEMLVGHPPFRGSHHEVLAAHITAPPPRPTVLSDDVASVLIRCLEKTPGARWSSASEFTGALLKSLEESQPDTMTDTMTASQSRHAVIATPTAAPVASPSAAGPVSPGRRLFVVGLASGAGGALAADWLGKGVFSLYSWARGRYDDWRRFEALSAIFRPTGTLAISVASNRYHRASGQVTFYPNGSVQDGRAVAAFRRFCDGVPQEAVADSAVVEVSRDDCLVASGSPVASEIARTFLPYCPPTPDEDTVESEVFLPNAIPYHFAIGTQPSVRVISGSKQGREARKYDNAIRVSRTGRRWVPRDYTGPDGFLKTDFLLISRLPASPFGGSVVLIAGSHGAGTRAFELLLDEDAFPASEVKALTSAVAGAPYFQVVLEADDMVHEGPTHARRLRLSEACPPVVIPYSPGMFRA